MYPDNNNAEWLRVFWIRCSFSRQENKKGLSFSSLSVFGVPNEIRTRVTAVKGRCPRPLDDGDKVMCRL